MGVRPIAVHLWGMDGDSRRLGANDGKGFASTVCELHGHSKCLRRAGGFVAVLYDRRLPSLARPLCHRLGRLLARNQQDDFANGPRSIGRPLATTGLYGVRLSLCTSSRRRRVCCGQVHPEGSRIEGTARLISRLRRKLRLPSAAVRGAWSDENGGTPRRHGGVDPSHPMPPDMGR